MDQRAARGGREPFALGLADRFTQLVGVPPITYLIDWRMQLAAARLRDTPRAIGQIAAELGYESEATFTRAFKRAMGIAPGRYRSMGSSFTVAVGN